MKIQVLATLLLAISSNITVAQFRPNEKVSQPTRIDFVFPLANQSPANTPPQWFRSDYKSTEQTYELFVPPKYTKSQAAPCVIFVSPGNRGNAYRSFAQVCRKRGIILAAPHNAGNNCPIRRRIRIILDTLDDVRRKFNIDPNRTYIGGFSGGARMACAVAFSLPEYFGGVIPICAAGDLRRESWLRHRVMDRISVAHITGTGDFNRGEVALFRHAMLKEVGVRSKSWVVKGLAHGIPSPKDLAAAIEWLEEDLPRRQALAKKYPATNADKRKVLSREQQARLLFAEAKQRLKTPGQLYRALMLMKGIYVRWQDLDNGKQAKEVLLKYQDSNKDWQVQDIAEQRRFLIARARALDAYATSQLPPQYEKQRADMLKAAIKLWQIVIRDGRDLAATKQARQRVPALEKLLQR